MRHPGVRFPTSIKPSFWGVKSHRLIRVAGTILMLLALIFLTWQAWSVWAQIQGTRTLESQMQVLQYELDTVRTPRESARPSAPSSESITPQTMVQLSKVINVLNLPWSEIFTELELSTPNGVAIVSIEPGDKGTIKMQSESPDLDLLLAHAAKLQNHGPFGKLMYSRHETNERDSNKPARLSFELALKSGGAP